MPPQTPVTSTAPIVNPSTTINIPPAVRSLISDLPANLPAVEAVATDLSHVKAGFTTSEFWIVLGTDVTALLAGVLPANSVWLKCVSAGVIALTSIAYLWGRISVKKTAIKAIKRY